MSTIGGHPVREAAGEQRETARPPSPRGRGSARRHHGNPGGLIGAVRCGGLNSAAALASLTAARRLAAELELGELALIEAARDSGATWSQVAAAMGARNRQTAQKRHADLSRRYPRPPSVDTAPPETPCPPQDRHDDGHLHRAKATGTCRDAGPAPRAPLAAPSATGGKPQATPKITAGIIGESRYELIKAPDHAESRAWHVLVGGQRAGLVRPTWRGERSRPGWEAVDNAGTALPATGIGRVTAGGNARTRDAAAVSLLRVLLGQQQDERKRKAAR